MTTPIAKFRKQMNLLVQHLETCLPRDKELEKHKMKIETAMKVDPRSTVEVFINTIRPHADHILTGNDSYFTDTSNLGIDSDYTKFCDKLKTWWEGFDRAQKEPVRRYFKLLLMLGTISIQDDPLRQVINKYRDPEKPLVF